MPTQDVLTRTLVELADTLVDDFDVVDLLYLLTDRCVEAFEIGAAGLMLAAPMGGDLRVMASSSATMHDLELYELQADEGPCLDAYRIGGTIVVEDLEAAEARWPLFAPVAVAAGFRSALAVPMRLRQTTIGALNLFRTERGTLPDLDLTAARAFADVATIAILQHQAAIDTKVVNDQLTNALNSRIVIEQAKGMLSERSNISAAEAFTRLRRHARGHNLRLAQLCQDFLDGKVAVGSIGSADPPT